jgi:hypothetical protein
MFSFFVKRKRVERDFALFYMMMFMVGERNNEPKNNDDAVRYFSLELRQISDKKLATL